jgi:tetratricopeptide (TPR) repeat protein
MENQVKRAIEINPNSYGGWLLKAIVDFLYRGDPAEAMESIKKAKRYVRGTGEWRYSQAFLQLWLGRYPDAIKTLDKIVSCSYSHENITACEVEDFNLKLLKQGKFKGQLYFWLGFLNYKKKNNLPQSLEYFEKFENECTADMILLKQKSTPWLRDIRRDMGINPKSIGTS